MMKSLNSSKALAQYTSQFVTVKMSTKTDVWQDFHREFKGDHSGSVTVPFMYIVRSDGTTMYTGSGMKEVSEMGQLLHEALGSSGKFLSEKEVSVIAATQKKVEELLEADDIKGAIAALKKVAKIGPLGEIPSYAEPAAAMNAVVVKLAQDGQAGLVPIAEQLESGKSESGEKLELSDKIKLLNDYLDIDDSYAALKPLKADFKKVKALIKKDDGINELYRDLLSIRKSESANSPSSVNKALRKLEAIVDKRKSGQVADMASALIKKLKAQADD